ncbi:hypothetical protein ACQP3D_31035, partial [Escherichia coli]
QLLAACVKSAHHINILLQHNTLPLCPFHMKCSERWECWERDPFLGPSTTPTITLGQGSTSSFAA